MSRDVAVLLIVQSGLIGVLVGMAICEIPPLLYRLGHNKLHKLLHNRPTLNPPTRPETGSD